MCDRFVMRLQQCRLVGVKRTSGLRALRSVDDHQYRTSGDNNHDHRVQRYILSMSTDDSTPSLTKFFASQSPAHFRPWSRREIRKSQSALYLLVGLSAPMNSSSAMLWISTCFSPPSTTRFCVMSLVTKLTARISRIKDELKLISLMRFKISPAVCGTSLRNSGLI